MAAFGNIQIVQGGDTKFSNARDGDMCVYTDTNAQQLHIGTLQNAMSAISLSNQVVRINQISSPGCVVQTVYAKYNTGSALSSTAWTSVYSVPITPKFSNSILHVTANISCSLSTNAARTISLQIRLNDVVPSPDVVHAVYRHDIGTTSGYSIFGKVPTAEQFQLALGSISTQTVNVYAKIDAVLTYYISANSQTEIVIQEIAQ